MGIWRMVRLPLFLLGRRGIHGWVTYASAGHGGSGSWKLPQSVAKKEMSLSLGVNSLTAFTRDSPKLWYLHLDSQSTFVDDWQTLTLPADDNGKIQAVSLGLAHFLVLSSSGKVYGCGSNYFGQTGQPLPKENQSLSLVNGLECPVKQVVCGLDHSLFLLDDGQVFACGWGADGQTGTGLYENSYQVKRVELGDNKICLVSTCSDSSFALTDSAGVFGWGNNEYRQLGVDSEQPQLAHPQPLDTLGLDGPVTTIAAGGAFTAFLTSEGSVYLAGYRIDGVECEREQMRWLHCGKKDGKVLQLRAGLNYLLALTSPVNGFIWGKWQLQCTPGPRLQQFAIREEVSHYLTCGPLGMAAFTDSDNSDILMLYR